MIFAALRPTLLFVLLPLALRAERLSLIWPTPNTAFMDGQGIETFVQPTASGVLESGLFGCRRSGGAQFHEGLDLKPIKRDRQREATDPIYAVMPGVVRHISKVAGKSSYGRYVVLEHPGVTPAVYTLYAHLGSITPGLAVGQKVDQGAVLGIMGRSASGYAIPKDRAHLHFEIGLMLSRNFQLWYVGEKFGSPNDHGLWNGMNLVGLDPLDFYTQWRDKRIDNLGDFFARQVEAVRVRVSTKRIPDFVDRYPSLLRNALPVDGQVAGWEVSFNGFGVPIGFTPLSPVALVGQPSGAVEITSANAEQLARCRCKHLAFRKGGRWWVGRDLKAPLELLFGLKL